MPPLPFGTPSLAFHYLRVWCLDCWQQRCYVFGPLVCWLNFFLGSFLLINFLKYFWPWLLVWSAVLVPTNRDISFHLPGPTSSRPFKNISCSSTVHGPLPMMQWLGLFWFVVAESSSVVDILSSLFTILEARAAPSGPGIWSGEVLSRFLRVGVRAAASSRAFNTKGEIGAECASCCFHATRRFCKSCWTKFRTFCKEPLLSVSKAVTNEKGRSSTSCPRTCDDGEQVLIMPAPPGTGISGNAVPALLERNWAVFWMGGTFIWTLWALVAQEFSQELNPSSWLLESVVYRSWSNKFGAVVWWQWWGLAERVFAPPITFGWYIRCCNRRRSCSFTAPSFWGKCWLEIIFFQI